ncbi:hypothetical protein [Blastomonas aquatica]|uniref:Uncharacterized protein n=1 Tax=Blastomonas aquatica TaxID=1510276 RepID=A0ABQ1JER5_9SPHN|nr:hypothetical protein [Blastomonas aquatica]GGB67073.1 hypothetical protein GCM10010833_22850 [Blastomonas aquatica]
MTDTHHQQDQGDNLAETPAAVRYPTAIAIGGGVAAAVGSSFIPMNAIEGFVTAYGIAELLPAAAPPLGNTARLALGAGIGALTAGALLALLPRGETETMGFETVVKNQQVPNDAGAMADTASTGSKGSRLAGWLRTLRFGKAEVSEGEITEFADLSRLRIRNGDQHPDAPVRAPIMASSDLGAPLDRLPPLTDPAPLTESGIIAAEDEPLALDAGMTFALNETAAVPSLRFAQRVTEARFPESEPEAVAFEHVPETFDDARTMSAPAQQDAASRPTQATDFSHLDIPTLLDRLETGLARRRNLASAQTADRTQEIAPERRVIPMTNAPASDADARSPLRFRVSDPAIDAQGEATSRERTISADVIASPHSVDASPWEDSPAENAFTDTFSEQTDARIGQSISDVAATNLTQAPDTAADDDMDAALRDALTTLRQLSDRQRNA